MGRWATTRLSYANVVATVALFIALGGGAWALAKDSVGSREIENGSVRSQELKDGDVRGADIEANAVQGSDVADDSLTGTDVQESSLMLQPPSGGQILDRLRGVDGSGSGLDADTLDGTESDDVFRRNRFHSTSRVLTPAFNSYLAITSEAETFEFREIEIRTTGNPHEFKVCSTGEANAPLVRYVNGIRAGVIMTETNDNCANTFNPGAGGDFQMYGAGVMIWGGSITIDGPAGDIFYLYGVDALCSIC